MTDFLYFVENPKSREIYIGFNGGSSPDRPSQHRRYGFTKMLARMPATTSDETAVQKYFSEYFIGDNGNSRYTACDAIYEYVGWLFERGFAVTSRKDLEKLAAVPWAAKRPEARHNPDEGFHGQLTFLAALPARERLTYLQGGALAYKSSESDEWFTPEWIIEMAKRVMGGIDTDPASHHDANSRFIKARIWYGKTENGLRTDLPWEGNVWLNPPYGRGEGAASSFVQRLIRELQAGNVQQAITNLNADSMTSHWFDPVWNHAKIHLMVRGRPDYWKPGQGDTSPSKGTVLSYFGDHPASFARAAAPYGNLIQRIEQAQP